MIQDTRLFWKFFLLTMAVLVIVSLYGCTGATGDITASDPMERGLSYIAAAIVTAAVIRAL
jgi:hypothetical protein